MKLSKIINILSITFFVLTIGGLIVLFIQEDFHAYLLKFTAFTFYASILLIGNTILFKYDSKITETVIKLITFFDFGLITFSGLILFDIIPFTESWHVIIGITIFYLLSIQLNLLGWSTNKHNILHKIVFLMVLLANLFIAAVFLFKINQFEYRPYILIAICISLFFFFVGVFNHRKKV